MMRTSTLRIARIAEEGDRVLFYRGDTGRAAQMFGDYYVIATHAQAEGMQVGDEVIYEPCGVNFGWFVRKAALENTSKKGRA